ncbi:MAG: dienelactone hydrolase family protein [Asticcacaulis sp.]|nr:dienelactone hydrolase family protein [Asticcacaulis sp.]
MLDTLQRRFTFLAPHIEAFGPADTGPRPAVLLFHACNGIRPHIRQYAQKAADAGFRAFVVDSFTPRGWNETAAVSLVCSGMQLHGYERSGDVLAALWGLAQRADVDASKLCLAGWSHGAWSIMDLMTQRLMRSGSARLMDPTPEPLKGVKSLFLVYPYINFPARSNTHPWEFKPRTLAVLARNDFLTAHAHSLNIVNHLKAENVPIETLDLDATHCFDEDGVHFGAFMSYDRACHGRTEEAFVKFLGETMS